VAFSTPSLVFLQFKLALYSWFVERYPSIFSYKHQAVTFDAIMKNHNMIGGVTQNWST
jgi:hypothetical protein